MTASSERDNSLSRKDEQGEKSLRPPSKPSRRPRVSEAILHREKQPQGGGGDKQGPGRAHNKGSWRDEARQAREANRRRRESKQEKVTAEMKRQGRAQRRIAREAARAANVREREEIFEVGEEGMAMDELAERLAVSPTEIVKTLFMKGVMAQINQTLDRDAVKLVAEAYGTEVIDMDGPSIEDMAKKTTEFLDDEDIDSLETRPPVVTIMGHVDHGKTSLLDFIRKTKVAAGEAGGITQRIGAYTVDVDVEGEGRQVTFLDTPGHEAFSAMRARGARVTDIAVIIVAADDGVRPQTLEAVAHAKAAGVPIVVAINKVDKVGAEVERVKTELSSQADLLPEEWGGEVPMVAVSAKSGQGVEELLETISLLAEITDIYAQPNKAAAGTIIEAHLDRSRGPVATLLVQNGTLHIGDSVVAGASFGKVRAMSDAANRKLSEAGPSTAIEILGLNMVPTAGDEFNVVANESEARASAEFAAQKLRTQRLAAQAGGGSRVTLSTIASIDEMDDAEALQRFNIILKADASGSLEAVKSALLQLPQESVMLRFLHAASGDITNSDIDLADASGGMIVGFNISVSEQVAAEAKRRNVQLRSYRVIYDLLDEVRAVMEGRLSPVSEKSEIGKAVVKAVFGAGSKRVVAGCGVTDGKLTTDSHIVVTRGGKELWEGSVNSLRRVKDDVDQVEAPLECGLQCDFKDWKESDVITAYEWVSKFRTLEEAKATTVS